MKTIFITILLALSLPALGKPQPETKQFYLISNQNLKLLSSKVNSKISEITAPSQKSYRLIELTPKQLSQTSQVFHDELNICGGFVDVTEELKGSSAEALVKKEQNLVPPDFDKTIPTFDKAAALAITKFNKTRLTTFLQQLTSFSDRSAYSQNGANAARWLGDYAQTLAQAAKRSDVTVGYIEIGNPRYLQPNTLVRIPGADSSLPATVIGAHMDTFDNNKPGADDDGSGVAAVMEIYTSLLQSGFKFQRDIYFAFYAAEERGLVGSGVLVRNFVDRKIPVRGALQLDMIGYRNPDAPADVYFIEDNVSPQMTQFLKLLATKHLTTASVGSTKCGYACSDHAQWYRAGIASAFPFETYMQGYNHTIHTSQDNKADIDHASHFVKLGIAYAIEAAEPVTR